MSVGSSPCWAALSSLLGGDDSVFDDLGAAVEYATDRAAEASARDAALEAASLVLMVADDVPTGAIGHRAAAVAVRAGLAVDEDGDMRCWSGEYLRVRVETVPREGSLVFAARQLLARRFRNDGVSRRYRLPPPRFT